MFENNRAWAARVAARDPRFFETLCTQQSPKYLRIYALRDGLLRDLKLTVTGPGEADTSYARAVQGIQDL